MNLMRGISELLTSLAKSLRYTKEAAYQLANENEDAVVENILQWLLNKGEQVEIFNVSGLRWLEVDNQWDLQNAERILRWVDNFLD